MECVHQQQIEGNPNNWKFPNSSQKQMVAVDISKLCLSQQTAKTTQVKHADPPETGNSANQSLSITTLLRFVMLMVTLSENKTPRTLMPILLYHAQCNPICCHISSSYVLLNIIVIMCQ
mgnify:CR=1 FL=1